MTDDPLDEVQLRLERIERSISLRDAETYVLAASTRQIAVRLDQIVDTLNDLRTMINVILIATVAIPIGVWLASFAW